jgi:hypothetical protein
MDSPLLKCDLEAGPLPKVDLVQALADISSHRHRFPRGRPELIKSMYDGLADCRAGVTEKWIVHYPEYFAMHEAETLVHEEAERISQGGDLVVQCFARSNHIELTILTREEDDKQKRELLCHVLYVGFLIVLIVGFVLYM